MSSQTSAVKTRVLTTDGVTHDFIKKAYPLSIHDGLVVMLLSKARAKQK